VLLKKIDVLFNERAVRKCGKLDGRGAVHRLSTEQLGCALNIVNCRIGALPAEKCGEFSWLLHVLYPNEQHAILSGSQTMPQKIAITYP
jgi:hypothetical protein